MWIQSLLQELRIRFDTPIILCDNQSIVALSHNPILHACSKHMELDILFVWEKVIKTSLILSHILAATQYTDLFTKPLSLAHFLLLRPKLKVIAFRSTTLSLKGECRRNEIKYIFISYFTM
jgi:histone deacetylase 1/2